MRNITFGRAVHRIAGSTPFLMLSLSVGLLCAQPTLRITSPKDGTIVNPGQALIVTVTAFPAGAFQQVIIIGCGPIGFSRPISAPPYRFTIQIPSKIDPGRCLLTADGATAPGQGTMSEPITIVVERADSPVSLRVEPSLLRLSIGRKGYLSVEGVFEDGTTTDLTKSSRTKFTSSAPSVASVDAQGIVTPLTPGSTRVVVTNGNASSRFLSPSREIVGDDRIRTHSAKHRQECLYCLMAGAQYRAAGLSGNQGDGRSRTGLDKVLALG
jgi:hypothetical protein